LQKIWIVKWRIIHKKIICIAKTSLRIVKVVNGKFRKFKGAVGIGNVV
jgi:hypothetical protein